MLFKLLEKSFGIRDLKDSDSLFARIGLANVALTRERPRAILWPRVPRTYTRYRNVARERLLLLTSIFICVYTYIHVILYRRPMGAYEPSTLAPGAMYEIESRRSSGTSYRILMKKEKPRERSTKSAN